MLVILSLWAAPVGAQPDERSLEQRLEAAHQSLDRDPDAATTQLQEIADELSAATKKDATDARLFYLLGRARFYLEDDGAAIEAFSRAAELAPQVGEYHYMKGVALRFAGRSRPAIAALREARKLEPDNTRYAMELASELLRAKRLKDAADVATDVHRIEPNNADALFILGLMKRESGDSAAALEMYLKAVAANPDHLQAQYNVGQTYQTMNKPIESLAAFEQVVRLSPGDWRARAKIIQNLQALGRADELARQREALFELYRAGQVDAKFYCREQFQHGDLRAMAFEYFELQGPQAVRYSFQVLPLEEEKPPLYRVSLGSYDTTNQIMRELGELKPDQRIWHLDGYFPGGEHRTYAFYQTEPSYDEVRQQVLGVMDGTAEVISKTVPATKERK